MLSSKNCIAALGVSVALLAVGAGPAVAGGAFIDPLGRSVNSDAGPRMDDNGRSSGAACKGMGLDPNGRDGGGICDPNGRGAAIDPNGRDDGFLGWLLRLFGWR